VLELVPGERLMLTRIVSWLIVAFLFSSSYQLRVLFYITLIPSFFNCWPPGQKKLSKSKTCVCLSDSDMVGFSPFESKPPSSDQEAEDADHAETHISIDWNSCQTSTFDVCTPGTGIKTFTLCHRSTTIEPLDSPLFRVKSFLLAYFGLLFPTNFGFCLEYGCWNMADQLVVASFRPNRRFSADVLNVGIWRKVIGSWKWTWAMWDQLWSVGTLGIHRPN
jgi:hypothetical protein